METCFDTGDRRGDVPTPYVFALVQLTRFRPVRWRAVGVCLLFAIAKAIASTASTGLMLTAVPSLRYCLRFFTAPAPQGHFFRRCWASPSGRSRHEGAGISGAPPLVKIRAGHQCAPRRKSPWGRLVWYRFGKSCQHYPGGTGSHEKNQLSKKRRTSRALPLLSIHDSLFTILFFLPYITKKGPPL